MAFTPLPAPAYYFDNYFDSIIDCLKLNNALPEDSFINNVPFFNFAYISKEAHVKELFKQSFDQPSYQALLKNIVSLPDNEEDFSRKMMTFAQMCLYKVLPCPDPHCSGRPREIVTHNQYKDSEYECPFYHHERDRRRIVISSNIEDFVYKANYYEADRSNADRENYSKNYFESMFHPLYYKMFRCKREYCNSCQFCPFYHHEQEKKTWDKMFNTILNKDRITYVKDKQKYYESSSATTSDDSKELRSSDDESATIKSSRPKNQRTNNNNNRYQNSPKLPHQNQNGYYRQVQLEGNSGKFRQFSDQKVRGARKDSGDSFQMNVDSFNKQIQAHRMC